MDNEIRMQLCSKCAAFLSKSFCVHRVDYGIERKVDCERCRRYRYGAAYVLTKKGVRYG